MTRTHHFRFHDDLDVVQHPHNAVHDLRPSLRTLLERDAVRLFKQNSKGHPVSRVEEFPRAVNLDVQIVRIDLSRESQLFDHISSLRRRRRLLLFLDAFLLIVSNAFVIHRSTHGRRRLPVHLDQIQPHRPRRLDRLPQRHDLVRGLSRIPLSHHSHRRRRDLRARFVSSVLRRVPAPSPRRDEHLSRRRTRRPSRARPRRTRTSSFTRTRVSSRVARAYARVHAELVDAVPRPIARVSSSADAVAHRASARANASPTNERDGVDVDVDATRDTARAKARRSVVIVVIARRAVSARSRVSSSSWPSSRSSRTENRWG